MSIRIVCKECREIYNVSDDLAGKRLRCRHCETPIRVPELDDDPPDDDRSRRTSASRRPPRDEVPVRSRRSSARSDFDEDDHEGRSSANAPVFLLAGGGVVLLLLLLVGAAFLIARSRTPLADNGPPPVPPAPAPVVIGNPILPPGGNLGGNPSDNTPPAPVPGGPLPGVMDPADVARVKRSTVMIRVELPNGSGGEGSGFFAMGREMIVTNAHVLGMLSAESLPPSKLTVIVHSGEAGEFSVPGRVLGVDRQNDLAIVGISGVGRTLPPPLAVAHAEKLHETQKVYIFGYPLGSQLGRNLTVSESSVSSLRRDESRTLTQVQVNGGMHHGNSGGPVTDSRGNVVAVSVAGIRGTQINFAIPAEFVHQAAVGRLAGEEVGNPYREGGKLYLPVVVKTLDPMQKLREVKVDVWAGRPGAPRLGEAGKTPQPNDGPRQTVVAQLRDNAYYAAVPIPVQEPGNVVWIQSWNGGERPVYGAAHTVPYNLSTILERQPVNLTFVPAKAERLRTVNLESRSTLTLFRGQNQVAIKQSLTTQLLERHRRDPGPAGLTQINLGVGVVDFKLESPRRRFVAPRDIGKIVTQFPPAFAVDQSNAIRMRRDRDYSGIRDPELRGSLESLFQVVSGAWETTCLPYPNKIVRPMETWGARVPMLVEVEGGRKVQQNLHLSCTYEGTRQHLGRVHASVPIVGVARSKEGEELGKVTGHALFDVEGGFLRSIHLLTRSELESGDSDLRFLVTEETRLDREEGNPRRLTLPGN